MKTQNFLNSICFEIQFANINLKFIVFVLVFREFSILYCKIIVHGLLKKLGGNEIRSLQVLLLQFLRLFTLNFKVKVILVTFIIFAVVVVSLL